MTESDCAAGVMLTNGDMASFTIRSSGSRGGGFTLIELLVVMALVVILSAVATGTGRSVSAAGQLARAKAELATLAAGLESYHRHFGDFPQTGSSEILLQSLIGKRGPTGMVIETRTFLNVALLRTEWDRDPFNKEVAVWVDPWGEPYRYAYKTDSPWNQPGFLLFSSGPDRVHSELSAGGRVDQNTPANIDNIYAGR